MLHRLVDIVLIWYERLVLVRVILSWVGPSSYHPIVRFIVKVTDPVLEPARRVVPTVGAIDFSPVLVFLVLSWLRRFLVINLIRLGC
ncbi:MAG: YggT family protein [Firmicutes bacterium]|jgi:YggT family protein|nr:YggT family protein [Bacillota bacterium]